MMQRWVSGMQVLPMRLGEITKVTVFNRGNGYTSLPALTINSTLGTGAELLPLSTSGVGRVLDVKITNYGLDYTAAPTITFNRKLIVKNATGNFTIGDELTSHTATIVDWDVNKNLLEIQTDVEDFSIGDVITSVGGITAICVQEDSAEATTQLEAVVRSDGNFITDRGILSEDTMRIQDSYYYQDYSYVVRIGESINQWRESIRRSVHPIGWNVFGEVSFATSLADAQLNSLRIQTPAMVLYLITLVMKPSHQNLHLYLQQSSRIFLVDVWVLQRMEHL